jgi:hypothetical protein
MVVAGGMCGSALAADGFYVGIDGGRSWSANVGNGEGTTYGKNFNGTISDSGQDGGAVVGANIGWRFSDLLRTDISYAYLRGDAKWTGRFPAGTNPTNFTADTQSHVLLLNGFLHGKGVAPGLFSVVDPFIGGGIGWTRNTLSDINESQDGALGARVARGTTDQFAYRLGGGFDIPINESLTFTTKADFYWLGNFNSGDSRQAQQAGWATGAIGAWQQTDSRLMVTTVGLRYSF